MKTVELIVIVWYKCFPSNCCFILLDWIRFFFFTIYKHLQNFFTSELLTFYLKLDKGQFGGQCQRWTVSKEFHIVKQAIEKKNRQFEQFMPESYFLVFDSCAAVTAEPNLPWITLQSRSKLCSDLSEHPSPNLPLPYLAVSSCFEGA